VDTPRSLLILRHASPDLILQCESQISEDAAEDVAVAAVEVTAYGGGEVIG
jgi:hypothetical protein